MKFKFVQVLLIGINCSFLTCCIAQIETQKLWCDGIEADTLIRNVTDCRLWIRCKGPNTSPSSGICPNPTYFSVELQKCTSKDAANCIVCPDTTSTSYQTVAKSCSRFIRCKNGVASEMSCGVGMAFNPDADKCEAGFYKICTSETTSSIAAVTSTSSVISTASTATFTPTPWYSTDSSTATLTPTPWYTIDS